MFHLSIVTPERIYFDAEVNSLIIPGSEGYLGVLPHHAPLITALKPGKVEFTDENNKHHVLAVSGGFLEVSKNQANLLVEAVESSDEIDIERAKLALKNAKEALNDSEKRDELEIQALQAALARAANRIKVYKETH